MNYVHPLPWYLRVSAERDVIEEPITGDLDINGWEFRKALGLLKKGNATLIEWLDSPVLYRSDPDFLARLRQATKAMHQPERSFHHYVHMARGNYREYLQGDTVRLKKYLYVLRPLLVTLWVEQGRGVAPLRFQDLVDSLVTVLTCERPSTSCSYTSVPWARRNTVARGRSSTGSLTVNCLGWSRSARQVDPMWNFLDWTVC